MDVDVIGPVERRGHLIRGWACIRVRLSHGLLLTHLLPLLVPGSDLPFQVLEHVQHLPWELDTVVFQPFTEQALRILLDLHHGHGHGHRITPVEWGGGWLD